MANKKRIEPARNQLELFDMGRLLNCIRQLEPRAVHYLFRGLLLTAATEPRTVSSIDTAGVVIMTAKYPKLGENAGKSKRSLQRYRATCVHTCSSCRSVVDFEDDSPAACPHCDAVWRPLVTQDETQNTDAEWSFRLTDVLPPESVAWFISVLESGDLQEPENVVLSPRQNETVAATKCDLSRRRRGDKTGLSRRQVVRQTDAPLYTASAIKQLASYAAAGSVVGCDFDSLSYPDELLDDASAVQLLYVIAMESGHVEDSGDDRLAFFRAAVAAATREKINYPRSWLRGVVIAGHHRTTSTSKAERMAADSMIRRADGLAPLMPSETAWSLLIEGLRRHDPRYSGDQLAEAVPACVLAAGRTVGLGRIMDRNGQTTADLRAEFVAAYESATQPEVAAVAPAQEPPEATDPERTAAVSKLQSELQQLSDDEVRELMAAVDPEHLSQRVVIESPDWRDSESRRRLIALAIIDSEVTT